MLKLLRTKRRLPKSVDPKPLQLWLERGDDYIPNPLATDSDLDHKAFPPVPADKMIRFFVLFDSVNHDLEFDLAALKPSEAEKLLFDLYRQTASLSKSKAKMLIRASLRDFVTS